jgi:hypothetical protein
MDAAAFPTPVGVNPSATILAVAEYKVEQFIKHQKETLKLDQVVIDEMEERKKEAEDWAVQRRIKIDPQWEEKKRDPLDPIKNLPRSDPRECEPVGIKFSEWMEGYHSEVTEEMRELLRQRRKKNYEDKKLKSISQLEEEDFAGTMNERDAIILFRDADLEGAESFCTIETSLDAEIDNLTRYLNSHPANQTGKAGRGAPNAATAAESQPAKPEVKLTGTITISGWPDTNDQERRDFDLEDKSTLRMFHSHGGITTFEYRLNFNYVGNPHYLYGIKHISDDPGLDVWKDTSTLYFGILRDYGGPNKDKLLRLGILRVPASKFFKEQLKSIEVTGTDDPARRSWALGAFAKFFFGRLVDVYVPEIDEVVNVVNNIMKHTHG